MHCFDNINENNFQEQYIIGLNPQKAYKSRTSGTDSALLQNRNRIPIITTADSYNMTDA